ncbi:MAG: phosphodiester glycosidase family protein [Desulfarculaceae bacterium]|nr:phosphodiester glycosidase family protein [Desulfarculaceae bacterium]MCF8121718.1 phosphodiester glycosidase family protein [Desulfarculaceae bacterium]
MLLALAFALPSLAAGPWQPWRPGLESARFALEGSGPSPRPELVVLRIDPARFAFRLLCAGNRGGKARTAREWSREFGLTAVINASMYMKDQLTSVGLMLAKGYVNNPRPAKGQNALLALDPLKRGLPPVRLYDLTQTPIGRLRLRYAALIQNYRLFTPAGKNLWKREDQKWSSAMVGQDHRGRVLFMICREVYPMTKMVERLLALPLGLRAAMYVEGGPEATLYAKEGDREISVVGSFGSRPEQTQANTEQWALPNVIGVVPIP